MAMTFSIGTLACTLWTTRLHGQRRDWPLGLVALLAVGLVIRPDLLPFQILLLLFGAWSGQSRSRVALAAGTRQASRATVTSATDATTSAVTSIAGRPGTTARSPRTAAEAAGLSYIHLPFDSKNPDPDVVDGILTAVGDKENRPVYIHCGSATRVAALWMIGRAAMPMGLAGAWLVVVPLVLALQVAAVGDRSQEALRRFADEGIAKG